jgi:NADH-quinone oxidoreductase subunit N
MTQRELIALAPSIVVSATIVLVMLGLVTRRTHGLAAVLSTAGLLAAAVSCWWAWGARGGITPLLVMDGYAIFFIVLILSAAVALCAMGYGYMEARHGPKGEFYLLLLLATLGAMVLVQAAHLASFFLGLELLSVSLYALIAYDRASRLCIEAGVKYLLLAGISSAVLLFGMALVYAELGALDFASIAQLWPAAAQPAVLLAGAGLVMVGIGFKLALVPFHLWTPDVYQGAPAPVAGFVASVSKGAVLALLLRLAMALPSQPQSSMWLLLAGVSLASMTVGNLLALRQRNVKRLLAYSSISHLGYILVAVLAGGPWAMAAASYYLAAYFASTLGAFGVVGVLTTQRQEADTIHHYRGLLWRRPWLTGAFTAMLLSLAGIPLTAGFVGKLLVLTAGVGGGLWVLSVALVINSGVGLYYYLRVVAAMCLYRPETDDMGPLARPTPEEAAYHLPLPGRMALAALTAVVLWLGVWPGPLTDWIAAAARAGSP